MRVADETELQPGQRKTISIDGRKVLVLNVGGNIYAVDDRCPHRGCSLSKGRIVKGKVIVCPCHSAQFDLETGAVVARHSITGPLPTHQVSVENGDVIVAVSR